MTNWRTALGIFLSSALSLAGCAAYTDAQTTGQGTGSATGPVKVAVAFYPFQFVAERVGGDLATVTNLTPPGAEPHDLELTPQQVEGLTTDDLVVYQSGFQPAVDSAIQQAKPARTVDTASFLTLIDADSDDGHDHGDEEGHDHDSEEAHDHEEDHDHDTSAKDPHTWLDPTNMIKITEHVRDALAEARPAEAEKFAANATALISELTALDTSIKGDLTGCKIKPFITSHAAFGYLAKRYGLTQVGINGVEPDVEPSAARIAEVQKVAKANNVNTIFFETLTSPAVAKSIAGDLGLKTDVLDPLEGLTPESRGTNYLEVMRANAKALHQANECS